MAGREATSRGAQRLIGMASDAGRAFPDAAAIATLRAHPSFGAASLHITGGIEGHFGGNLMLSRVMSDRGRVLFAVGVLCLDAETEGGLTAARMMALTTELGLSSPGRAKAMLALLRWGGYLAAGASDGDRRERRLVPTEKLWAAIRARWQLLFEGLAVIEPTGRKALALIDEPAFRRAFLRALAGAFRAGYRPLHHAPALAAAVERDAGLMILLALDLAASRGLAPPPIAHLAGRFGVSRAHVLAVLREAEAAGLVGRDPLSGAAIAAPSLHEGVSQLVAAILALAAMAAAAALGDGTA